MQCWLLLQDEFINGVEDYVTIYKFFEIVGIGFLTGCVWFLKGSQDTQTALGESVGLFFFSTALWTVPPVFQALAMTATITERVRAEWINGMYSLSAFLIAMAISSLFITSVWVCFWQIIAYSMADLGATWLSMLAMHLTLSLNCFAMRTIGLFLGIAVPQAALNVVIANLFAQMCMLVNGFYTKLPFWLQWITVFSIPRYTYRALIKLEYSWEDTFEVHPSRGIPELGYPTKYISAELTGIFQLMHDRQMDVMQSHHASSPGMEILAMASLSMVFLFIFGLMLKWRVQTG